MLTVMVVNLVLLVQSPRHRCKSVTDTSSTTHTTTLGYTAHVVDDSARSVDHVAITLSLTVVVIVT